MKLFNNKFWSEETPKDWEKAKEIYDSYQDNRVFRGWSDGKDEKLIALSSTFDRIVEQAGIASNERWAYEALMLRLFRRKGHHYISSEHTPENNNHLEWLSLMRHYGTPCRFVDVTYSFYIATYFALKSSQDNQVVAIWAIDLNWLIDSTERNLEILNKEQSPDAPMLKVFQQPETFAKFFFSQHDNDEPYKCVVPVAPLRLNKRIIQQQGLFLCPGDISKSFKENLKAEYSNKELKDKITKIILPSDKDNKRKALKDLKRMNISSATLFPDLGGFAQSLEDIFFLGPSPLDTSNNRNRHMIEKLKSAITHDADLF